MQFFRRKRYRFFYPAGLISLVLLPLLGYYYIYSKPAFEQKYVIEINTLSPQLIKNNPKIFPDPAKLRQYKPILLTGNDIEDAIKLRQFQLEIRNMISNKDTIKGAQIIYGSKAKYNSFVESINICYKENASYWAPLNNNFYVIYRNPTKQNYLQSFCGTSEIQAYYDRLMRNEEERLHRILHPVPQKSIIDIAKSFWPAGILYIIMVSLTARKVVRQFRNYQQTTSN